MVSSLHTIFYSRRVVKTNSGRGPSRDRSMEWSLYKVELELGKKRHYLGYQKRGERQYLTGGQPTCRWMGCHLMKSFYLVASQPHNWALANGIEVFKVFFTFSKKQAQKTQRLLRLKPWPSVAKTIPGISQNVKLSNARATTSNLKIVEKRPGESCTTREKQPDKLSATI